MEPDFSKTAANEGWGSRIRDGSCDPLSLGPHGAEGLLKHIKRYECPSPEVALAALFQTFGGPLKSAKTSPHLDIQRTFLPIRDKALTSLRALLVFAQTAIITFNPLSSSNVVAGSISWKIDEFVHARTGDNDAPHDNTASALLQANPISMYRAARQSDLPGLQSLAEGVSKLNISPQYEIIDSFSRFSSQNPKIKDMLLSYAKEHWDDVKGVLTGIFSSRAYSDGSASVVKQLLIATSIRKAADYFQPSSPVLSQMYQATHLCDFLAFAASGGLYSECPQPNAH
ncbi:uncharacterized protein MEPE_05780 [Melanopsichium pennsylvanicum]|uniref:Uncharacterized protein n=2 Tax=Melanopsichium pennsylvanicum TaxID=63383 RepID=A0AAJ4XRA8_9BASI|nr:conserved hypothetical protein [Melanopsichium pennsylvanicum 4]SNX87070.1 uncharacterized protein MEPE_05780 [Melanopsichium pennsylvanicum]